MTSQEALQIALESQDPELIEELMLLAEMLQNEEHGRYENVLFADLDRALETGDLSTASVLVEIIQEETGCMPVVIGVSID